MRQRGFLYVFLGNQLVCVKEFLAENVLAYYFSKISTSSDFYCCLECLDLFAGKILEAYNTGVAAFRQHKSDGLTSDRIDSTMLNMEEVWLWIYRLLLRCAAFCHCLFV